MTGLPNKSSFVMSLLLATVALPFVLHSQSIVFVDTSLATFSPQIEYWEIDLNTCTDELIIEIGSYEAGLDIAIRPDELVFGIGVNNFPSDTLLYAGSTFTTTTQIFPDFGNDDPGMTGMACDENGFGYAAGAGLTWLDLDCCDQEETYLGDFPTGLECQGDITYRRGKFYMAAVGNRLVEVDVKNPGNSQVVMDFPLGTLPIHGLATVQLDCDSVETYAIGVIDGYSEVYHIDFDTWNITTVCDLPEHFATGGGSFTECMLPPCSVFVDLDENNSSFGYMGNYCADTFCISPKVIADDDVVILSGPGFLDSVTFELIDLIDLGEESLTVGNTNNMVVIGDGTAKLTLISNGATLEDFEEAIASIAYLNMATSPTPGMRKVFVTGFAGPDVSLSSTAELPLFNPDIQLQADLTEPSCHGFSNGSIFLTANGGSSPYSFEWDNGGTGETITNLSSGIYEVTVTDGLNCATTINFPLEEPDTLSVEIDYDGPHDLCDMSGGLIAMPSGGTYPYLYNWDNGVVDSINAGIGAGTYQLTLMDLNGCDAEASIMVSSGDTILIVENQEICQGETVQWQGSSLSSDTLACVSFIMPGGCDSTVCLDLRVNQVPELELDTMGSLCNQGVVVINAGQHDSYLWSTGEILPEITINSPGAYSVEVSNAQGCTNMEFIEIPAGFDFIWEATDPTCFGESNGQIEVVNLTGGAAPFGYSLDGISFSGNNLFENLSAGEYTLIIQDAGGCSQSVGIVLTAPAEIILDADEDQEIKLGESIRLNAVTNLNGSVVSWSPPFNLDVTNELSVLASPIETTLYTVEVVDTNSCNAQDEILITVSLTASVFVPNSFSPNGDGINDLFQIYTETSSEIVESMRVYDRWGELVFREDNYQVDDVIGGWDGTFKGKQMQAGVYVFIAHLRQLDGKKLIKSGEVILIR